MCAEHPQAVLNAKCYLLEHKFHYSTPAVDKETFYPHDSYPEVEEEEKNKKETTHLAVPGLLSKCLCLDLGAF